ncbi:uncharacterized protein BDR25DRAFT_314070 [Lindgomyces ingoldianus]|uniref:Uncharacterized protein n=1 Tax=Lindgomyces ingoldianus TaxID=673940 RepID=A0ACB6QVB8_9PLEO|nr:uncharacterized protein BDR25DRAFT_314070 [Lindgomyces ingoldianus]KAF2470881.1 hypothetical protein BDR25DRAFT_314070 [Lindgomyces ingoldianus]
MAGANSIRCMGQPASESLHVEDLELTTLSGLLEERKRLEDAPSVCHQVQWKTNLLTTSTDKIIAHCQSHEFGPADLEWVEVLHSLTLLYAILALQSMGICEETCRLIAIGSSMKDYARWLSRQVDVYARINPKKLGDLIEALPSNPVINGYVKIGQNLPVILSGDIQLGELLPREWDSMKLIQQLDTEIGTSRDSLETYIDCLTHKHPNLHFGE